MQVTLDAAAAKRYGRARQAIGKAQDLCERFLRARKEPLRVTKEQAELLVEIEHWLRQALDD